jgi:hypothetical protein
MFLLVVLKIIGRPVTSRLLRYTAINVPVIALKVLFVCFFQPEIIDISIILLM